VRKVFGGGGRGALDAAATLGVTGGRFRATLDGRPATARVVRVSFRGRGSERRAVEAVFAVDIIDEDGEEATETVALADTTASRMVNPQPVSSPGERTCLRGAPVIPEARTPKEKPREEEPTPTDAEDYVVLVRVFTTDNIPMMGDKVVTMEPPAEPSMVAGAEAGQVGKFAEGRMIDWLLSILVAPGGLRIEGHERITRVKEVPCYTCHQRRALRSKPVLREGRGGNIMSLACTTRSGLPTATDLDRGSAMLLSPGT
jgi:hypothetical protein